MTPTDVTVKVLVVIVLWQLCEIKVQKSLTSPNKTNDSADSTQEPEEVGNVVLAYLRGPSKGDIGNSSASNPSIHPA